MTARAPLREPRSAVLERRRRVGSVLRSPLLLPRWRSSDSDYVREDSINSPEVCECADDENNGDGSRKGEHAAGRRVRAEQPRAKTLHHAGHWVEVVREPPALRDQARG